MLALVALVGLGTADLHLIVARQIDTSDERVSDLSARVALALREAGLGVAAPEDTRSRLEELGEKSCNGQRPCVRAQAAKLGSPVVVTLDVGHVRAQMVVGLEALAGDARLAHRSFTADSMEYPAGIDAPLRAFAAELATALKKTEPASADAPLAAVLTPAQAAPQLAVVAPASRSGPVVLGAAAAASLAASIVCLAIGASAQVRLDGAKHELAGTPVSELTWAGAEDLAARSRASYSAAWVLGSAGVIAAMVALIWGNSPP